MRLVKYVDYDEIIRILYLIEEYKYRLTGGPEFIGLLGPFKAEKKAGNLINYYLAKGAERRNYKLYRYRADLNE